MIITYSNIFTGNEYLNLITKQGLYELRIDLEDFEGEQRFAKYRMFRVAGSELGYQLTVGGYSGNAGIPTSFILVFLTFYHSWKKKKVKIII